MRSRESLVALAVCIGFWAAPHSVLAQCTTDADCNDGVFCNGIESCDTASGACVAVSACPPFIDGCLVGGACDEENDVCLATPDDSLCQAGQVCEPSGDCVPPVQIILDLITAVDSLAADDVLNKGQANSLITKLNGARRKLDLGQIDVACNLLSSFIAQVTDLVHEDGVLTEEQGQPLIESAARVRHALGCPEADDSQSVSESG